jgi:hypothetical protein
MSIWDWYNDCMDRYVRDRDRDRLRMGLFHPEGFDCQETDPERSLALFTAGRNLAEQLSEPWWVLFYDVWRVQALIDYLDDYRQVLDLAVRTALEFRKPSYIGHPWKFAIFNHLLRIYTEIDPVGHAAAIREAMAYLDAEVPPGPGADRYVLSGRKRKFAMALNDLEGATRAAQESISLAASDPTVRTGWYTVGAFCDLCLIYQKRGAWAVVGEHAGHAETLARGLEQCESELSEAQLWQAVVARHQGDGKEAGRLLRAATGRMARLRTTPSKEYFYALALYHELAGDLEAALQARDRELVLIRGKGRLVSECETAIERCRLLARLGRLNPEAVTATRAAARLLRVPDHYLTTIDAIVGGAE